MIAEDYAHYRDGTVTAGVYEKWEMRATLMGHFRLFGITLFFS